MLKIPILGLFILVWLVPARGQRQYRAASVLASGGWYKIAVKGPGVYKVDLALLSKLGAGGGGISSASIRLFGNGGAMLPEACNGPKTDDLQENPIMVVDGGDGVLNGNDYFLFYAAGPDNWKKDPLGPGFSHQKNYYTDYSYYYISLGGSGRRVAAQGPVGSPGLQVQSFSEHYFHELDSINFLSSGKDWYGEEISNIPGHSLTASFPIPLQDPVAGQPALLVSNCVARSIGSNSQVTVGASGNSLLVHDIAATSNSNFDLFAHSSRASASFIPPAAPFSLVYTFQSGGINAQGWVDWFEFQYRRSLRYPGSGQLLFRDLNSVGTGNIAAFRMESAVSLQVWDITDPLSPVAMTVSNVGGQQQFTADASSLHEYVAFANDFLLPDAVGKVENQNLHGEGPAGMLLVTVPDLLGEARRLADFHLQKSQLKTLIVTTDQVFNEFSSGSPDPAAIRDFAKMFYDRAAADSSKRPAYLLLLGDASFDYKNRLKNNTNLVPAYENGVSLDPLSTYTSDDFFGFLQDKDDINSGLVLNLLDIGIGRIPAQNAAQARAFVDKLLAYHAPPALGPWRNEMTFIADDQDQNLHFNDAETITAAAKATNDLFDQDKIYLDAYKQVSTPSGSRYPDVNLAINNQIQNGTLIWNYNGHGSYTRLAEEVILEQPIVNSWTNGNRLPLFITATCDFAPYDNPAIFSLGENILLREKSGAIALMTTTRLVFAYSNRIMNQNYLQTALQQRPDGTYPSLGEAVRQAKNYTYQTQTDASNNRKFTLLGDPAMTLAYPYYQVQTSAVNGHAPGSQPDTLRALEKYTLDGQVTDGSGNLLSGFTGTLYSTVFDKPQTLTTLANDPDSYKAPFQVERNQVFKGKVHVQGGRFSISFVVPKDINYQWGRGRISYYADNGQQDGNGVFTNFVVGGSQGLSTDQTGPVIKAYLNDEKFVDGSIVNQAPVLLLHLTDSSGINILGTGIGHDLSAELDGDPQQVFVLNQFYESDLDSYQKGTVRFQLPALPQGQHTLVIKAWDVANNSSQVALDFRVFNRGNLTLTHVLNYPNPFTTHTAFWFEHNRPGEDLAVMVQIFTVSGRLLKTIRQTINTPGNRSSDIEWNGMDDFGSKLGRGVYIYQLKVRGSDGKTATALEKLVIL